VTGPIEDERIKPWATVLRVPTAEGFLYFKEPVASLAHEARLIEILAARHPELVTEVLFSDEDGRMLMRDAGEQLSAVLERDRDTRYWEEALPLYAELQIAAVPDAQRLVDVGVFDRRSALFPELYERLIAEPAENQTPEEYEQLLALRPEVDRVSSLLASSPVPETINNDDFTHGSIFLRDGSYRFLDWGDACVSHPFITLTVTQRVIEIQHGLPPGSPEIARIRDAYLEPFTIYAPRSELEELVEPARHIGQICRVALRADTSSWGDEDDLAWTYRLLLDPEAWRGWLNEPEAEQPPRSGPVS
jgi:Phosphotransferase enzyme family